jgi:hypothetical protein
MSEGGPSIPGVCWLFLTTDREDRFLRLANDNDAPFENHLPQPAAKRSLRALKTAFSPNPAMELTTKNTKIAKRGGYELVSDVFHSSGG